MTLAKEILGSIDDSTWTDVTALSSMFSETSRRQILRAIEELTGSIASSLEDVTNADGKGLNRVALPHFRQWLTKRRLKTRIVQTTSHNLLVLSDLRGHLELIKLKRISGEEIVKALNLRSEQLVIVPHGQAHTLLYQKLLNENLELIDSLHSQPKFLPLERKRKNVSGSHLWHLEQESIYIIREAVAKGQNPGMLFSLGKDSMVMLRLAQKAFAPEKIPFPLVNIDTRWKFQEMNTFREWVKSHPDLETIHFVNPEAIEKDINPFEHGSAVHTDITKTQALKKLLSDYKFDFVFGGARRDEEKSRAKERVFSVRDKNHSWDPKNQRPELWDFYNTTLTNDQSMRVFPLSNWTERDIWDYLEGENVPLVPLYFAKIRPFVVRNGALIMVDDERFRLEDNEEILFEKIRFRSLGCYPLSGGVRSSAGTVAEIAAELAETRVSERSSRVIDFDRGASMEQKKKEGYF